MSEPDPETEDTPAKASKMPLIIGLVLAIAGGGGGFYATWSGMILGSDSHAAEEEDHAVEKGPEVAFVSVDPLVVSLGDQSKSRHLRFRADLEVPLSHQEEVTKIMPRVIDVLNSYLRALEPGDLEGQAALTRLRGQMLRRVQVVVGQGRVSDLLVMEFVLN